MEQTKFEGIYQTAGKKKNLLTRNLTPGHNVYSEKLVNHKGIEYREWDPFKSKLAAAILKGLNQLSLEKNHKVLYLGAASGTTVSHISDIVGNEGIVYGIEFSPTVIKNLVFVAQKRKNIAPILADANQPQQFFHKVTLTDFLYQDIAQKNQAQIFLKNLIFLKDGGFAVLCVKSRSIDISKKPGQVFKDVRSKIEQEVKVVDKRILKPFQKDHCFFVCKKD